VTSLLPSAPYGYMTTPVARFIRLLMLFYVKKTSLIVCYIYAVGCVMPSEWLGVWYEAGVGDVTITAHGVPGKGDCVDHINDFYLLDNGYHFYLFTNLFIHSNLSTTTSSMTCEQRTV